MKATVAELAARIGGTVVGDAAQSVTGFAGLSEANAGDISFLANPKYAPLLVSTKATAVLVNAAQTDALVTQIVVKSADFAFAMLMSVYGPQPVPPPAGIHPSAVIGERVQFGADVAIGPFVVIGDGAVIGARTVLYPQVVIGAEATLGDDNVLYPHVTVRERCVLGHRVILQPGAVIGSDGFGYATVEGVHHKIPQVGTVVIEDDVEIGANTAIDRARLAATRIGRGAKLDNLVQIAHNVEVGAGGLIAAQAGIAGSTKLGKFVTLAGQCGISGHLTIGDQVVITGQAGVSKDFGARAVVRGSPAMEFKTAQRNEIAVRRLPETQATVKELRARVAELERKLDALLAEKQAEKSAARPAGA